MKEFHSRNERRAWFHGLSGEEKYAALQQMVDESARIVFFGGAGVSTESGIPDFRSKDGLYNKPDVQFADYAPEYLLSHDCLFDEPKVFFEFCRQKLDVRDIQPNAAHYKLAEMERAGKLSAIVTQNIDGLHEKAGSHTVYNIHGTTFRNYCTGPAHHKLPADFIMASKEAIPHCPVCGRMVRPDVTLYGEALPDDAVYGAVRAIEEADMLIIAGTSLTVYPAASFVRYFQGENLVIINRDATPMDSEADLVFHESIGKVLSGIRV